MSAPKLSHSKFGSSAMLKSVTGESLSRFAMAPRKDGSKFSRSGWQLERQRLLQRLCRCIDARVQRGQSVAKAARRVVRKWTGSPYKCDSRKTIRLSVSTLTALYGKWRVDRSPVVFKLLYVGPTARRIPTKYILEIARRSKATSVFSLQTVLRGVRADWERGKSIPGLGTWRQWGRRNGLKIHGRKLPVVLPFSRTVYRHFSGIEFNIRKMHLRTIADANAALAALDRAIIRKANDAQQGKADCR